MKVIRELSEGRVQYKILVEKEMVFVAKEKYLGIFYFENQMCFSLVDNLNPEVKCDEKLLKRIMDLEEGESTPDFKIIVKQVTSSQFDIESVQFIDSFYSTMKVRRKVLAELNKLSKDSKYQLVPFESSKFVEKYVNINNLHYLALFGEEKTQDHLVIQNPTQTQIIQVENVLRSQKRRKETLLQRQIF